MWYTATSASVTTGATVVAVTTGDDISIIQEDSGLVFEGESPVQVKRGYIDGFGDKFIELASPWPYTDKVAQPIVAYPTDASFAEATAELRRVIDTLEVASTVDMQAATNDVKIATPLKVKQAIDFNTGTAATRDVGENAGNVMEVGAFGLGPEKPVISDLNEAPLLHSTAPSSVLNMPAGAPTASGAIDIYTASFGGFSATKHQTITYFSTTSESKTYQRTFAGTWTPWVKTYHTGNILGTVSQSGGVPTGAIIERGSNVNGEYVRYADGTMICKYLGDTNTSAVYPQTHSWNSFPSTFQDNPTILCQGISWRGGDIINYHYTDVRMAGRGDFSSGVAVCQVFTTSRDGGNPTNATRIMWQAIGRWF